LAAGIGLVAAGEPVDNAKKPSVLVINGMTAGPMRYGDFDYFQRLNQHGFQIDSLFLNERPLNWNLIKQYNCLVILDLPPDKEDPSDQGVSWNKFPPYKKELLPLLESYLKQGGGIFFMPALWDWGLKNNSKYEEYLTRWGAKLPFEEVQDPASLTVHPRNTVTCVYTEKIAPSPVSEGVKGIWFPGGDWMSYWSLPGMPLLVSKDWIEVVRGSDTSFTKDPKVQKLDPTEEHYYKLRTRRPDAKTPPTLYAIRELREGRLALCAMFPQFTVLAGTTWIHDGMVLDKGIGGRPSDFGRLFENTLRWLAEPSLKSGVLGGYVQDPKQLVRPNLRKKPEEFFSQFNSYQNPTAPGNVYRGLVGARTTYSSGRGTVEEYAKAATDAGLDFIVFLEEFGKKGGLTEAKYRNLEADCRQLSTDKLLLIPGFSFRNNIGNYQFVYGKDVLWPSNTQFVGPNGDELRHQCFDKEGKLDYSDEDAKNWLWTNCAEHGRNLGYYNFANSPADTMPVRDLRIFGILGVMTYLDGKLVEDLTPQYISYAKQGDPPLACAVEIVHSPAELVRAVKEKHYLTHVAAARLADLPVAMQYGSQYGRANVNPSSGPQIKSWAGTQRILTFAGEPFLPSNYRLRPFCWVTSEVGLKEIVIYDYTKPYRRILLHGAKEFKQIFEWAFDRHHVLTLDVTDSPATRKGGEYLRRTKVSAAKKDRVATVDLRNCDCLQLMATLKDKEKMVTLTSPPFKAEDVPGDYWTTYDRWIAEEGYEALRAIFSQLPERWGKDRLERLHEANRSNILLLLRDARALSKSARELHLWWTRLDVRPSRFHDPSILTDIAGLLSFLLEDYVEAFSGKDRESIEDAIRVALDAIVDELVAACRPQVRAIGKSEQPPVSRLMKTSTQTCSSRP
jgi:hypothetical protein